VLTVSLPVYNEEDGIEEFLRELQHHLSVYEPRFIVVDDHSTDSTAAVLNSLTDRAFPLTVVSNEMNLGHGGSVLRGLAAAIALHPTRLVLCDGDGQFHGEEVARLVKLSLESDVDIVEGIRRGRNDPWFRRVLSFGTQVLVLFSSRTRSADANTPLRVLKTGVASDMLHQIPTDCPVPNLAMSAMARSERLSILQTPVQSRPARRKTGTQDHWRQRFSMLPSRRLITFAWKALVSRQKVHRHVRSIR